eukprot:TRINITY_DN807_c0_g1_i2.p1 TRINITY_DN807_c0_g1~~TRINITY_DN807_c0_g1_i2.p1  ORF type:complete len:276 (+),score=38.36 TRINITY_DN807_c0_g1_i2:22-849(+)
MNRVSRILYKGILKKSKQLEYEWKRGSPYLHTKLESDQLERIAPEFQRYSLGTTQEPKIFECTRNILRQYKNQTVYNPSALIQRGFRVYKEFANRLKALKQLTYQTAVTTESNAVSVSIQSSFLKAVDGFKNYEYQYTVTIQNHHPTNARKLIDRNWIILSGSGYREEVFGPGVVGKQPTLSSGQSFTYKSFTKLVNYHGTLLGKYQILDLETGESFYVPVGPVGFVQPIVEPIPETSDDSNKDKENTHESDSSITQSTTHDKNKDLSKSTEKNV